MNLSFHHKRLPNGAYEDLLRRFLNSDLNEAWVDVHGGPNDAERVRKRCVDALTRMKSAGEECPLAVSYFRGRIMLLRALRGSRVAHWGRVDRIRAASNAPVLRLLPTPAANPAPAPPPPARKDGRRRQRGPAQGGYAALLREFAASGVDCQLVDLSRYGAKHSRSFMGCCATVFRRMQGKGERLPIRVVTRGEQAYLVRTDLDCDQFDALLRATPTATEAHAA